MTNQYPTKIEFDNEFSARSVDLDTFDYPALRVVAWSNVFGPGGAYAVEPVQGSTFTGSGLPRISVDSNDASVRQNLEDLVEEFNEDPRGYWLRLLGNALEYVANYAQRQVDGIPKLIADAAEARARVDLVKALAEKEAVRD